MIKRIFLPACLLTLAMLANAQTPEAEVRKVIDAFTKDWNNHDAKAIADLHTDDANFINIYGEWIKGKSAIGATMRKVHSAVFAKSKMLMDVDQVKFPSSEVAVVNGTMELLNVPPDVLGKCHYIRVLKKTDGKWLISEFQNTKIRSGDPAKK